MHVYTSLKLHPITPLAANLLLPYPFTSQTVHPHIQAKKEPFALVIPSSSSLLPRCACELRVTVLGVYVCVFV